MRSKKRTNYDSEMKIATFELEEAVHEVTKFLACQMAEQEVSMRKLAALGCVSATMIQGTKSRTLKSIKYIGSRR
jgi:hypothetical protein